MQLITIIPEISNYLLSTIDFRSLEALPCVNKYWKTITESDSFCKHYTSTLPPERVQELTFVSFKRYLPFFSENQVYSLNRNYITRIFVGSIPLTESNKLNLQAAKLITSLHALHTIFRIKEQHKSMHINTLNSILADPTQSQAIQKIDVPKQKNPSLIKLKKSSPKTSQNKTTLNEKEITNLVAKDWKELNSLGCEFPEYILKMEFAFSRIFHSRKHALSLSNTLFKAYCESMEIANTRTTAPAIRRLNIENDEQLNIFIAVFNALGVNNVVARYNLEINYSSHLNLDLLNTFQKLVSDGDSNPIILKRRENSQ